MPESTDAADRATFDPVARLEREVGRGGVGRPWVGGSRRLVWWTGLRLGGGKLGARLDRLGVFREQRYLQLVYIVRKLIEREPLVSDDYRCRRSQIVAMRFSPTRRSHTMRARMVAMMSSADVAATVGSGDISN